MTIKIYSTPTCPYCIQAKEFFKKAKIDFEDFDVSKDQEKAKEMVEKSGQSSVPVIDINGKIIIGFDKEKIEETLKK